MDCEVLESTWKTNGGWSWLEEGLGRHPVFIGLVGLCKGDKSMSNFLERGWLSPLSQAAVNVLQSPKGEFPLHVSVIQSDHQPSLTELHQFSWLLETSSQHRQQDGSRGLGSQ